MLDTIKKKKLEFFQMKVLFLMLVMIPVISLASDDGVRLGRYSLVSTTGTEEQKKPLHVVINTRIPRSINTVKGTLDFLLMRSGYSLADETVTRDEVKKLYKLRLPEVHRKLGPIKLINALHIVSGEPFIPIIDPVHRLVSFELDKNIAKVLGGKNSG